MKNILFLFLLAISLSGLAQEDKAHFEFPDIMRSAGASFQQFDGLNSRIANFPQYKQVRDQTGTLQLGWFKEMHQFITICGLTLGSSLSGDRDKKSSVIRYYGLNADFGYDLMKSEKIILYPLAGIGFQKYQARFFKDNSQVNFDDLLQSPAVQNNVRPLDLKNLFLTYRFGLGISVKPPKCPFLSSIGLQAGYTASFKSREWKSSDDQALLNAPEDKLGQYYVLLVLTSKPWFMKHLMKDK
jgi:hypothetical protein